MENETVDMPQQVSLLVRGGRRWAQVFYDLHLRYPWAALCGYLLAVVVIIGSGVSVYKHHHNDRLLEGSELVAANNTYDAIRTADALSEDFSDDSTQRQSSRVKAEIALAAFQARPHEREGNRAVAVFTYYLAAVETLPDIDSTCAMDKLSSHASESHYLHGHLTAPALVQSEVKYMECLTTRGIVQGTIRACHDEALSYLVQFLQPPVDTCVYRSNEDVVVHK